MHLCRGCKEADYPWKQFVHLNTASNSLYMWHNLVHFPYLCPRPPEGNNLSWLTILIPVINTSTCKWHICNYLLLYSYNMCTSNLHDRVHFANNYVCTSNLIVYIKTEEVGVHVTLWCSADIICHEMSFLKNYWWIEPTSMGHVLKPNSQITWISRNK